MKDFRDGWRLKLVIGKTDRSAKDTFLSAKAREEHLFPRRATKGREGFFDPRRTPFYPRRDAKGREEHLFVHEGPRRTSFCPRRHAKGREERRGSCRIGQTVVVLVTDILSGGTSRIRWGRLWCIRSGPGPSPRRGVPDPNA